MQYGRKAFGPHGYRTPQTKAHDIALSILVHLAHGRVRTLADYGLTTGSELYTLVEETLERLTTKQAA